MKTSPRLRSALLVLAGLSLCSSLSSFAQADEPTSAAAGDKDRARALYKEGVAFVEKTQWSDALASFEGSAKLYPSPVTTLSIGSCERALGRYVRARSTLQRALDESAASPSPLPESSAVEAKGFLTEIDRVIARAEFTVEPVEAAIAIDGRPLAVQVKGVVPTLAAGVLPPGPGSPSPAKSFIVVLDPGVHVITLSRKGFTDAVVNRTFSPGTSAPLAIRLDLLPATLKVTSSHEGALVRVNDADVGPAPVDVLRPAGSYQVQVKRDGFVPYKTQVTVQPGQEVNLRAALVEERPSLFSRWWFWTGAAAVVAGGAAITYAVTRPTPKPPAFDKGNTDVLIQPSAFHF